MCHVSVETEIIDKISASQDITILDMGGSYGTCGLLENKLNEKKNSLVVIFSFTVDIHGELCDFNLLIISSTAYQIMY